MKADSNSTSAKVSRWSTIKRSIKRFFILISILFAIVASILIYWKYFYTYSEGYRAGLLQKFSHKGNLFKTYEGEMILSSVSSNTSVVLASEKFFFSVTNRNLANQLDTIQGRMVIVHYQQRNGILSWRGDSEYLVDSVKRIR